MMESSATPCVVTLRELDWAESDVNECEHGYPEDVVCWECIAEHLIDDIHALEDEVEYWSDKCQAQAVMLDALAAEI